MVRQRTMSAVKCSVKAGYLRQSRAVDEKRTDGSQVVRLVQWSERDKSLQTAQHFLVNKNGAAVVWASVYNAMAHRNGIDAKFIAQPSGRRLQSRRHVRHCFIRICPFNQGPAAGVSRMQLRLGTDPFNFAFDLRFSLRSWQASKT